jgi:hypothetical protein
MDEAERLLKGYRSAIQNYEFARRNTRADLEYDARENIRRYEAAVLAAMRGGGVPEGYWLAPIQETPEMRAAGNGVPSGSAGIIWEYMRKAAPQPPALDRDGIIEECVSAIAELRNGKDADSTACYFLNNAIDAIRAMKVQR